MRRIKKPSLKQKELRLFNAYRNILLQLPAAITQPQTLLIIRLDDIGDYILWRNSLHVYATSPKWKDYTITLLGNIAWKTLFDELDKSTVYETIWIRKSEYYSNTGYREKLWQQLRATGFETVVCAANTRPVLLDDVCMLATGATNTIGTQNTLADDDVNRLSDGLYGSLYQSKKSYHEFFFNQDFTNWCCNTNISYARPFIEASFFHQKEHNYILCYIGASKKSRRWPATQWIEFIHLLQQVYTQKIIVSCGPAEDAIAETISKATNTIHLPGKTALTEMIDYAAFADVVITNNTMMAHLAPACNRPTLIIDNGDNFSRMTAYKRAGISGVETVYAHAFLKEWKKRNHELFSHYVAISSDIKTIKAQTVMQALQQLYPPQ